MTDNKSNRIEEIRARQSDYDNGNDLQVGSAQYARDVAYLLEQLDAIREILTPEVLDKAIHGCRYLSDMTTFGLERAKEILHGKD